jgi:hypothetical protein
VDNIDSVALHPLFFVRAFRKPVLDFFGIEPEERVGLAPMHARIFAAGHFYSAVEVAPRVVATFLRLSKYRPSKPVTPLKHILS